MSNSLGLYNLRERVAWTTLNLCIQRKVVLSTSGIIFCMWQRDDRLIIAFDPNAIDTNLVNNDFAHRLSTRLEGRPVVRTNSRGIYLQVGFEVPPAPMLLEAKPLNLSDQSSSWDLPIGPTKEGPLWISLVDADSLLIGGSRGKGKSGLVQGMIQALLHGGKTQVYAWDGKQGAEFGRYITHPKFHFISDPNQGLKDLAVLLEQRLQQLLGSGYPNIIMHNNAGEPFLEPIALFVDEIAELDDHLKEALKRMVKLYRASGLYPILATNDPTQAAILVKTNLSTRICFAVPSFQDSMTVLGMKGAEALTERGRGMIIWDGRLIDFHTFDVQYPPHTEDVKQLITQAFAVKAPEQAPAEAKADPKAELKQKVIEAYLEYVNKGQAPNWSAIERAVYGMVRGGSYHNFIKKTIAAFEGTTTITPSPRSPVLGLDGAVSQ
jgi:hypothetical protein